MTKYILTGYDSYEREHYLIGTYYSYEEAVEAMKAFKNEQEPYEHDEVNLQAVPMTPVEIYRRELENALASVVNEDTGKLAISSEEAHEIAIGYSDEALEDIMKHSTSKEYAEMYLR